MTDTVVAQTAVAAEPQRVFVSYAREDNGSASALVAALKALSVQVWWDQSLRRGEQYRARIEREIDAASIVVVLWSQHSVQSTWVRAEADRANDANKLVSIRIADVKLPLPFGEGHVLELPPEPRSEDSFRRLCERILEVEGAHSQDPPAARDYTQPRVDPTKLGVGIRRAIVGACIAVVALSTALLYRLPHHYAARRDPIEVGSWVKLPLLVPLHWNYVLSILSAALALLALGVVVRLTKLRFLTDQLPRAPVTGAGVLIASGILGLCGVRDVPVQVSATTTAPEVEHLPIQFEGVPLEPTPAEFCRSGKPTCVSADLPRSPCKLQLSSASRDGLDEHGFTVVSEQTTPKLPRDCSGVWTVNENMSVAIDLESRWMRVSPQSVQLKELGALQVKDMSSGRQRALQDVRDGRLLLDVPRGAEVHARDRTLQVTFNEQSCGQVPVAMLRDITVDLCKCAPAPVIHRPKELPVETVAVEATFCRPDAPCSTHEATFCPANGDCERAQRVRAGESIDLPNLAGTLHACPVLGGRVCSSCAKKRVVPRVSVVPPRSVCSDGQLALYCLDATGKRCCHIDMPLKVGVSTKIHGKDYTPNCSRILPYSCAP